MTKHAAVGLAEWLAITHGDAGIKVSVLCPQAVRTAMTAGNEDGVASVDGMIEPEDVAEAVIRGLEAEAVPHPPAPGGAQLHAAQDRGLRPLDRRHAETRAPVRELNAGAEHSRREFM